MKLLLLDIETAPNLAYVWGLFKENIPLQRLVDSGYVLCWSAKWYGTDEILFASEKQNGTGEMLNLVHDLMDEADAVIHYNGANFDIPTLNKEFLKWGFAPPAPYKQIDLYKVAKKQFRLPSYKMDYVAQMLGLEGKVRHPGFQMWVDCMKDDSDAWKEMEKYNKGDVILLEKIYEKFLPWIDNHPNYNLYVDVDNSVCPNCGGVHLQRRGYSFTSLGKFIRYQCQDCGKWARSAKNEAGKGLVR